MRFEVDTDVDGSRLVIVTDDVEQGRASVDIAPLGSVHAPPCYIESDCERAWFKLTPDDARALYDELGRNFAETWQVMAEQRRNVQAGLDWNGDPRD